MRRGPAPAARRWEIFRRPLRIWLSSAQHTTWIELSMAGADYGDLSSMMGHRYGTARVSKRPTDESAACLRARYRTNHTCLGLASGRENSSKPRLTANHVIVGLGRALQRKDLGHGPHAC